MTFTFDISGGFTDLARVRFYTGDTDETAPMFSDELLTALIVEKEDWQGAVRAALSNLISTLSRTPNFQADWLKVDAASAIKQFRENLAAFEAEYGSGVTFVMDAEAVHTYRADSHATSVTHDGE